MDMSLRNVIVINILKNKVLKLLKFTSQGTKKTKKNLSQKLAEVRKS